MGALSQIKTIQTWSTGLESTSVASGSMGYLGLIILVITVILYSYLARIGKRWLAIPACAVTALAVALIGGAGFDIQFTTEMGLPNLNPAYWGEVQIKDGCLVYQLHNTL